MSGLGNIPVFKIRPDAELPRRASDGAVGYDVFASRVLDRHTKDVLSELPVTINPGEAVLIGIGVVIAIPLDPPFEIQVRPRSGLANKFRIELSNSPGTVDPDFRGEVGCLLVNRGDTSYTVEHNDRIAQLIFSRVELPDLRIVENLNDLPPTRRGAGGFGSTGSSGYGLGTLEFDMEIARIDRYFMGIVIATASLSNCIRGCARNEEGRVPIDDHGYFIGQTRRLGCVIAKGLRTIATGFNAQYPGSKFCADIGCLRDELGIPSGTQLEKCRAIHAEQMAIMTAAQYGVPIEGATMYVNSEPCEYCAKMVAGSGIQALVIKKGVYPNNGLQMVRNAGISVREIEYN